MIKIADTTSNLTNHDIPYLFHIDFVITIVAVAFCLLQNNTRTIDLPHLVPTIFEYTHFFIFLGYSIHQSIEIPAFFQ